VPQASIERVERAIEEIRQGRMVILVDDEDRENEGDLTMAAERATPEAINFMAKHGRGLICLTLTEERVRALELNMMVEHNTSSLGTAFTVSIEARRGVTTGISAADRATTIATAIADGTRPEDLVRPGHVFPLRARDGGVLVRSGQTEGSVDLARLAGLKPAGVICEIMRDDGEMARRPDLERFAEEHALHIVSVADLVTFRLQRESLVRCLRDNVVYNAHGSWRARLFQSAADGNVHLALSMGEISEDEATLVRVHSSCVAGEGLGLDSCRCGANLRESMARIAREGRGVVLYLQQDAVGTSLLRLFDAHVLRVANDPRAGEPENKRPGARKPILRELGIGAQILRALGVRRMRLLSSHDRLLVALEGYGLEVAELLRFDDEAAPARGDVVSIQDPKGRGVR
jgi:3,4-dihydroxy 2-butanone 4-phosphate synthase/GTP cyclohydrolase II